MLLKILLLTFSFTTVFGDICSPITNLNLILVKKNVNDTEAIPLSDVGRLLSSPAFKPNLSTIIYCYGFTQYYQGRDTQAVVGAYLQRKDHNILVMDWSQYNAGNYFLETIPHTMKIGEMLGQAIVSLTSQGFDISKLHMVGHSMGAHLLGQAGRVAKFLSSNAVRVPRITGLDPAGPGFYPVNPYLIAVNKFDANFVDIIHTDFVMLGANASTGHADYWPNGGKTQPGCPPFDSTNPYKDENFCSHRRAWHFYAESVTRTESNAFQAIPCTSWTQFVHQKCKAGKTAFQMGFHAQAGSDGNFYLQTNSQMAFSRDALGVCYSSKDKQY